MTWAPPKEIVFGEGKTRRAVAILVVRLSDFHKEYREHFGASRKGPIPLALWCGECNAVYLRADRRSKPTFRNDFLHEIDHCWVDYRGEFYEPNP